MKKKWIYNIAIVLFVLLAAVLYIFRENGIISSKLCIAVRGTIHSGLILAWLVSMRKRLMESKAKTYFGITAYLILFWLAVRCIKYLLPRSLVTTGVYIWYLYYLPMLFIPVFILFATLSMNRGEGYVIPKRYKHLYIPPAIILALILTNDLHQWAFINPRLADYGRGPVYYLAAGWIASVIVVWLIVIWRTSRIPNRGRRILLPFIPVIFGVIYTVVYVFAFDAIKPYIGDMTAVLCMVFIATLEICIQNGLVPVNVRYEELFAKSSLLVQITDKDFFTVYKSDRMVPMPDEAKRRAVRAPVGLEDKFRLSCKEITDGYVFWMEDLSELYEVLDDMEDLNETLASKQVVLSEENNTRARMQKLIEKDRIYNKMQHSSRDTIEKLLSLTREYSETDGDEGKKILAEIAVLVAYLKRRNNLIFIPNEKGRVSADELAYCIKETVSNLKLLGAEADFSVAVDGQMKLTDITAFYDMLELAAEEAIDGLTDFYCLVTETEDFLCLRLSIVCDGDLGRLSEHGFSVEKDDEKEWSLEYRIKKGGERQ